MTGRAAELGVVAALSLGITLAIAAPVLRAPSERLFGMEIVGRHHDPFTAMEQFASPIRLGIYSQPVTDMAGVLLSRVSGPVAAYNWLVLLTFPLSAVAAYALARHLKLSTTGATVSALAYAFSPFHLAHAAYHPHIAQTQWLPLYLLALWRCLDAAAPLALGWLLLAAAAVALSNFYAGLIVAVLTPIAIAGYWLSHSRPDGKSTQRLAITCGGLALIAGAGFIYAWFVAHDIFIHRDAFAFVRGDLFRYSAKWWGYVVPPVENPWLGGIARRIWMAADVDDGLLEQQVSVGSGLVALGGIAAMWRFVDNRHPPSLAAVPLLVVVAGAAMLCSLSPERRIGPFVFIRPSAVLYSLAPMFRAYARFGVMVQLMVAMLAGIGVDCLQRSATRYAQVALAILLVVTAVEYAVWPPTLWRDVLPTSAHRWATRQPGVIRVLDCAPLTAESESVQWLTGSRIWLQGPFDDCMEPNIADKLAAAGYTHLLVRANSPEGKWFAAQTRIKGLQAQTLFADSEVFRIAGRPASVYTAGMTAFFPREANTVWSWRWMGSDASWNVVNNSGRTVLSEIAIEMSAFQRACHLLLLLDGRPIETMVVEAERRTYRISAGPLTPGGHQLLFHPTDPGTIADLVEHNGDRRTLSIAVGAWLWTVRDEKP